jgi:hypothetical protein
MGLFGEARKDVQDAESARLNAVKEARARTSAEGANYAKMTTALRQPRGAAGAGGANKLPQVDRDAAAIAKQIVDLRNVDPNDKQIPMLESKLTALKEIIATTKTSDKGPNAIDLGTKQILGNLSLKSSETARKLALQEMSAKNLIGSKDQDSQYKQMYKKHYEETMGGHAKTIGQSKDFVLGNTTMPDIPGINQANPNAAPAAAPAAATGAMTPTAFNEKWATLKKGQSLVGPDGVTYTKQ